MYMCGVWQRLLWNNSMCSIMKSLQKKRTWTRKAYFLKQCIRDSWFHKNPVFSGKRTWALNSFIKRDWEFMSRNRVSHLHLGLPSILENVYISLRHFSIAEKFSFSPSLLDFFFFHVMECKQNACNTAPKHMLNFKLQWSFPRIHNYWYFSYMGETDKGAQGRTAENSAEGP